MGFFKEESMRLAKESIKCVDDENGQVSSLFDLEKKHPSFFKDWEEWNYDVENEEVTAVGSFGLDGDICDKMLTIRVRPIDNERFVIYSTKVEENVI